MRFLSDYKTWFPFVFLLTGLVPICLWHFWNKKLILPEAYKAVRDLLRKVNSGNIWMLLIPIIASGFYLPISLIFLANYDSTNLFYPILGASVWIILAQGIFRNRRTLSGAGVPAYFVRAEFDKEIFLLIWFGFFLLFLYLRPF